MCVCDIQKDNFQKKDPTNNNFKKIYSYSLQRAIVLPMLFVNNTNLINLYHKVDWLEWVFYGFTWNDLKKFVNKNQIQLVR